ncbi:MAG: hypothetical protein AB2637_07745, partial [Candidatus Thiodiazotropha sp.]
LTRLIVIKRSLRDLFKQNKHACHSTYESAARRLVCMRAFGHRPSVHGQQPMVIRRQKTKHEKIVAGMRPGLTGHD